MSKLIALVLTTAFLAGTASAQNAAPPADAPATQPSKPSPAPAASGASAEVKAAKGVEKREPVEPGASFEAGATVWAWSLVSGAEGTTVKHVWKKDGTEVWHANLKIGSKKWTTYSRRTIKKAGSYSVDVVGEDGTVLGTTEFTVQ
jgi:hypothetical protein